MSNNAAQPLSTIYPGVGSQVGIDLNNEVRSGTFVGSGNIDPQLSQFVAVPLTAAQILGMFAAPVTLVPAVAAKSIVLDKFMLRFNNGVTQFAGGGAVVAQFHTGAVATINTIPAATITAAAASDSQRNGIDVTSPQNSAMELTNATGAFTAGNGSAIAYCWYSLV